MLSTAPARRRAAAAAALTRLAAGTLAAVDRFYDTVGGLAGYQLLCVRMLAAAKKDGGGGSTLSSSVAAIPNATLTPPPGLDLTDAPAATAAKAVGLAAVGTTAEIVPLGGASDRLGLTCEKSGASLPAALLPYGGRPLLDAVLRDTQAREYLAWRVTGVQHVTPVALMTSCAKGGDGRVRRLLEKADWYGRGASSFRLICQPLVPLVAAADGRWLVNGEATVELRPGGHGALWKCLADSGAFDWLAQRGARSALVRQISNPLAGTDGTLLALGGAGAASGASFGFACCPRRPGTAEGVVASVSRPVNASTIATASHVTCIEYTEFDAAGLSPAALDALPANSNLLYVDLPTVAAAVTATRADPASPAAAAAAAAAATDPSFALPTVGSLPGLVFNASKTVTVAGHAAPVAAGRLESTMQNVVDFFPPAAAAATFAVTGPRRVVTSSAKRARKPGGPLAQTPDGSFLDLARNGAAVLRACGVAGVPEDAAFDTPSAADGFLPLLFTFHPALGPVWDVVAQKVSGGDVAPGSELSLDLAEACVAGLSLAGSLRVIATAPLGHAVAGDAASIGARRLVFSYRGGRARIQHVRVRNAGVDWTAPTNVPWRGRLARVEGVTVTLRGRAEFDAAGVDISGSALFDVPDSHRLTLRPGPGGRSDIMAVLTRLEEGDPPAWEWRYEQGEGGRVALTLVEHA